jgi:ribosomal protein uL22
MKDYNVAVGAGSNLPISRKHTREILHLIKGMSLDKAIKRLELVKEFKIAVPFKRYKKDMGHKKGMAAGRYPINACNEIIKVLMNAKNNAINQGLQEEKLVIDKALTMMNISKSRRMRVRKGPFVKSMKSISVKIIVKEKEIEEKKKPTKKKTEKEAPKKEEKPVKKKAVKKEVKKK